MASALPEDFTDDGQIYDAVLDTVGKSSFRRSRHLLKPGGIYASSELGLLSQNPVLALVTPLFRGRKVVFPFPRDDQSMIRHLGELIDAGEFRPVVDRRSPLDQIVAAYEYVETGQKIGSVVIDIAPAVEGRSRESPGI
jgi:NADPH:quinone reductase-like Zn-dependent oxidoreductase